MNTGNSKAEIHVLLYLYITREYIGRVYLSRTLGIGEGRLRSILSRLYSQGIIERIRAGVKLSKKGLLIVEDYLRQRGITRIFTGNADELGSASSIVAETCLKYDTSVNILKLRDEAVRGGAQGAIILKYRAGRLIVPPLEDDLCLYARSLCREISGKIKPSEGSIIIVVFADTLREALSGLVSMIESKHYLELSQASIT